MNAKGADVTEKDRKLRLVSELDDIISQSNILTGRKQEILTLLADDVCPYKIGQEVVVKGYSHRGKRCVITKRDVYIDYNNHIAWKVVAQVYKKDGTLSQNWADWSGRDER